VQGWVSEPAARSKTQSENKHVEGVTALCPDAGSNPASSTNSIPGFQQVGSRGFLFLKKGSGRQNMFCCSSLKIVISKLVDAMLRKARENAGLSHTDVALKSGTTRNYISRIENDKSDIQLETLQKMVELGIGGEIVHQIKDTKEGKKRKPVLAS